MPIIAAITIGQSPRDDIVPEMKSLVPGARWVEAGALDGWTTGRGASHKSIASLAPRGGDFPLITRLRDGRAVVIGQAAVLPHLQHAIDRVESRADLVLLLCSGMLAVDSRKALIHPDEAIAQAVHAALRPGMRVAVLTPEQTQVEPQRARWRVRLAHHPASGLVRGSGESCAGVLQKTTPQAAFPDAKIVWASPYAATPFDCIGRNLREASVDLIVMDCMAYTLAMGDRVADTAGAPVLLARAIAARAAAAALARAEAHPVR